MEATVKGIIQPKTFSFEWKIKRFLVDCERVGAYYTSELYQIQYANKITKWYLMVYPKGRNEENKNWTSLFLYFDNKNETEVTVDYRLSISSEQNSWPAKEIKKHKFSSSSTNYGWFKFVELDILKKAVTGATVNDTFTILCEITFHTTVDHDVTKNFHDYDEWIDKIEKGFGDYEKLLENEKFSDVTFKVQNKKLNVHKNILSCRSPVFSAMFEHDMQENKKNECDIIDISYDVMKELFRFIYSGKVKNIENIASELLIAADKYQVIELKALCEKTLYDSFTVDNAVEYLKLTDMCDTIYLKRLIIKFTVAHYKQIMKKPGFEDLNNKVMYQIMLAVAEEN